MTFDRGIIRFFKWNLIHPANVIKLSIKLKFCYARNSFYYHTNFFCFCLHINNPAATAIFFHFSV